MIFKELDFLDRLIGKKQQPDKKKVEDVTL